MQKRYYWIGAFLIILACLSAYVAHVSLLKQRQTVNLELSRIENARISIRHNSDLMNSDLNAIYALWKDAYDLSSQRKKIALSGVSSIDVAKQILSLEKGEVADYKKFYDKLADLQSTFERFNVITSSVLGTDKMAQVKSDQREYMEERTLGVNAASSAAQQLVDQMQASINGLEDSDSQAIAGSDIGKNYDKSTDFFTKSNILENALILEMDDLIKLIHDSDDHKQSEAKALNNRFL